MTTAIDMGLAGAEQPALLDLEELLATRLLVQGNSGSGKSHLLRRLLEQSAPWVQQVVIDPEGEFPSLAEGFSHVVIDAAVHEEAALRAAADRVRRHRVSVILTLEGLEAEGQLRAAAAFLGGLFEADRAHWYPLLVVVDEAQIFAPAAGGEVSDDARKLSLAAMTNLMCRGRKRGLAGVVATQRLAKLAKNVAAEASNFLMGRTFLDIDMARAAELLGLDRRAAEMFRDLARGQFVGLGPALSRRPLPIRIGAVQTDTRPPGAVLLPLPQTTPDAARDLILAGVAAEARQRVRPPPPPPPVDIAAQLAQAAQFNQARSQLLQATAREPLTEQDQESRRDKLSAATQAVLAGTEAAFRPVTALYQDFLVHCRIQGVPGGPIDLAGFRRLLATARAGIGTDCTAAPHWQMAVSRGDCLPDDAQGVFLLIARAALERLPCPSDADVARVYGTQSLGRARRLLAYMEERGVIVCQQDRVGQRTVTLTELGWETAPGLAAAA